MPANTFVWYELMTSDPEAGERFYANVVGWTPEPFSPEPRYTVMKASEAGVAGVMPLPEDFVKAGGHPCWVGYIGVADLEAATQKLWTAGGTVHKGPIDIPEIGRFSVVADPQGAMFMLFQPKVGGAPPPTVAPGTPGHGGWRELYAADWQKAFDFYSGQFGWTKDQAVDMGEMGTYQTFAADGTQIGGMMNKPAQNPRPVWQYYFTVEGIEGAAERVKASGGTVLMGPHEVPGGSWIVNCTDPQGAHFALVSPTK